VVIVTSALLLAATVPGIAQTNAEVNAGAAVQFNLLTPGARSLGLGGAFVALADDATAAYSNPAGLTALSLPEVSAEVRSWGFTNTYTDRGRASGAPSGVGVDTIDGLRKGRDKERATGLSFLSVVYPKGRWSVAFYRHELAKFSGHFEAQGAVLEGQPGSRENGLQRSKPTRNSLSLDITNLGLATACKLGNVSIGAGVSLYDFELNARTDRYAFVGQTSTSLGGGLGPPLFSADNIEDTQIQSGAERDLGFNAGALWQVNPDWRLGLVYREGPKFAMDAIYLPGPKLANPKTIPPRKARFDTPDVYGLGVAYLPTETVTVTLDFVRVGYSDLTHHFTNIFPFEDPGRFQVDDANEVHLGGEKFFTLPSGTLLAARVGAWRDPDHNFRYTGTTSNFRALFQAGKSHYHSSVGIGWISSRYQIDAAFDYSSQVSTASLSTVVRF